MIRLARIFVWLISSLIFLFLLILLLLQFPSVQTALTGKLTSWLKEETGAVIEIERVAIRFPRSIGLKGIYIEEPEGDTLLYAGSIYTRIRMTALLRNRLHIRSLEIEDLTGNVIREKPDTMFNFQFIADSFKTTSATDDTDQAGLDKNTENGTGSPPDKKKGRPFRIRLNRVILKSINVLFADHHPGIRLRAQLDYLETTLGRSDLLNGKYHAGNTVIRGSKVILTEEEPSVPSPPAKPEVPDMDISLTSLNLQDVSFSHTDPVGNILNIKTDLLTLVPRKFSLRDRLAEASSLHAENLNTSIIISGEGEHRVDDLQEESEKPDNSSGFEFRFPEIMAWTVSVGSLELINSYFRLGERNIPVPTEVFDPGNFSLDNLNLSAENIFAGPDSLRIDLGNLNMLVSEIFRLDDTELDMNLGERAGKIDLKIHTSGSSMDLDLGMDANLLDFALDDLADQTTALVIKNSSIGEDLAFFIPLMNSYYFNWPDTSPLEISSYLTGTLSDMLIDSLRINGPDLFSVFLQGDVSGLPDTDSMFLDLETIEFWSAPGVLFANFPGIQQPQGIGLPEFVLAEGRFRGSLEEFETGMDISSDLGDVELLAELVGKKGQERSFEGKLFTGSLDIAKLLQTDIFQQPLSLDLDFRGNGLEPETMELDAGITIRQLLMMEYAYDDIVLDLALKDSIATLTTAYKDDFLSMDLNTEAGIFKEIITAKSDLLIEYAALHKLGLADGEFFIGTEIDADIILSPVDFFSGRIIVSGTNIAAEDEIYSVPEIEINSDSSGDNYSFELISEFLNAKFHGSFTPVDIPQIITDHISEYFTVSGYASGQDMAEISESPENEDADTNDNLLIPGNNPAGESGDESVINPEDKPEDEQITGPRHFDIELHLFPSEVISRVLLPALEQYDSLSVLINYDSQSQKFSLDAVMDEMQYSGMHLKDFKTKISSGPEKMDFGIFLKSITLNKTSLYDFDLSGRLFDETLDFSFSFKDDEQQDIFLINAMVESTGELYNFRIDPANFILNKQNWEIPEDNMIVLGQEHLRFNNFTLEHDGSMLSIRSPGEEEYDNVTVIALRQFDIRSLTGFADEIIPLRGGILDGDLNIRDIYGETGFTADISVNGLLWSGYEIDMITLQARDAGPGQINILSSLEYDGTTLRASGDYFPGESPAVDMEATMDNFNLQIIEAFAGDQVTNVSGTVTGKINVKGDISGPEITGEINFTGAGFRIVELNVDYFLKDERITFDKHNVRLQDFTLEDSQGRTANLDGGINFGNFENLIFDLNFSTRNFMLMNLPKRRGGMYYGTILMDSDLRIKGSHNNPSVDGRLRLNEESTFTFIIPQTTPEAIGGKGIVEFISPEEDEFFRRIMEREDTEEIRSSIEVMTVNLNIELDSQTELTVIIDEMAGDYLELRGGGVLTFGIDPGGAVNLTGRYDVTGGEYRLSFHDVASRTFSIREGSNIIFTGDPMEAELDITAVHTVRTSGEQLIRSGMRDDQTRTGSSGRQYPFLVSLNMEGELMSPNISFSLDMPPGHRGALDGSLMTRINAINENESELNKQVFALLILGNFIHENPLEAASGPGISSTARSSASQILSQQLNRLSDRYVKGMDISFELESYEVDQEDEVAGRTELQVEVSRNFFNERVRIVVGGNIELEDETHRETRPGEIAGDFTLEYLLTPDGNLILRGFRKKDYGDLIEGELTKTGVSLVFSRSYNKFRELFRREEEETLPEEENNDEQK
ncbi:MAG: translocation/assembly module TamB domain-containing protein [Bacteroidales bacterium]